LTVGYDNDNDSDSVEDIWNTHKGISQCYREKSLPPLIKKQQVTGRGKKGEVVPRDSGCRTPPTYTMQAVRTVETEDGPVSDRVAGNWSFSTLVSICITVRPISHAFSVVYAWLTRMTTFTFWRL
jgi:hypothetical protein